MHAPSRLWRAGAILFAGPLGCCLLGLAGCSGGGSATVGGGTFTCVGGATNAICLQNCNLGCNDNGCARTDIAQNEIVILQFSQAVDPRSVNSSSIRFRTASGDQPVGEFFVNGNQVEFVPTLAITGGQTFYGFTAGETYTMTILGGETQPAVVRSTSGKPFAKTMTCSLRSTMGIVDLNQSPPRATLLTPSPAQLEQSPRNIDIVLEFNELIDSTPFTGGQGPVEFKVRRTKETADPNDGIARECDGASPLAALAGTSEVTFDAARQVSTVTFHPAAPLPANVCIEITVTTAVTDLSGRSAAPQQFVFETETIALAEFPIVEEFTDQVHFDEDGSAATWGNGQAVFAQIGGDGRHGTFKLVPNNDPGSNYGGVTYQNVSGGKQTYLFDLDFFPGGITIPASSTTTGAAMSVTDGRFFFDKMIVPADTRLRFKGSVPPVFTVAGRLEVLGEIDIVGQAVGAVLSPLIVTEGQAGGLGGVFAGNGGKGGNKRPDVVAPPADLLPFNGTNGQAARVPGGHGYALSVVDSGGRGSQMFPASGAFTDLLFPVAPPTFTLAYTPSASAGGGGGGMAQAGSDGRVIGNNHLPNPLPGGSGNPAANGPSAPGGIALGFLTAPAPADLLHSSVHFLVGGSGGGGAGSHACLASHLQRKFSIGGGGGGGGGAIAFRAGDSLRVGAAARILASGGATPASTGPATLAYPALGGGGSGGSIVLQTGRVAELAGVLDVRGGAGGLFNRSANGTPGSLPPSGPPNGATVQTTGGNGSAGFVRFEAPGSPAPTELVGMQPGATAANVGTLVERDLLVSFRSDFYSTGLVFGPDYSRYEIHANINGNPVVYSDDPAVSTLMAGQGQAIRAMFQPATVDLQNGTVTDVGIWYPGVRTTQSQTGIQSAGLNGFRFALILDTAIAPSATIDKVVVVYRN